jgi:hypothetical protein
MPFSSVLKVSSSSTNGKTHLHTTSRKCGAAMKKGGMIKFRPTTWRDKKTPQSMQLRCLVKLFISKMKSKYKRLFSQKTGQAYWPALSDLS